MDAGAGVVVVAAAVLEGNQSFWCCGWVLVAYPGQQDSGGTLNDTKRTPRQEITKRHRGKPQQPGK